jgi:NADH:ubiquinone oxidoreductase subunit 4 (subunit M)
MLLSTLVGALLGLISWESLQRRRRADSDNLVISLLILASFAIGVFVTYLLMNVLAR